MGAWQPTLEAALVACRRAGEIQRAAFQRPALSAETKPDGSPVTVVDRQSEAVIRATLAAATPEFGFLGEESGAHGSQRDRWVVDPLDGTLGFLAGLPFFAVLIALEVGGERVLGVAHAPILGATWWAVRGAGAFLVSGGDPLANADPLRLAVSTRADPAHSLLVCGELGLFLRGGAWDGLAELILRVGQARGYGDFWGHLLVAEGRAEIMVDPRAAYHDLAAVEVIVHESGGTLTTPCGMPLGAGFLGPAVSSNRALAALAREALEPRAGLSPEAALGELDLHDGFA